jgi:hypothetical protein
VSQFQHKGRHRHPSSNTNSSVQFFIINHTHHMYINNSTSKSRCIDNCHNKCWVPHIKVKQKGPPDNECWQEASQWPHLVEDMLLCWRGIQNTSWMVDIRPWEQYAKLANQGITLSLELWAKGVTPPEHGKDDCMCCSYGDDAGNTCLRHAAPAVSLELSALGKLITASLWTIFFAHSFVLEMAVLACKSWKY